MFELRPAQKLVVEEALPILTEKRFVYLTSEVRTGKTHCSLWLAEQLKPKDVLFITTKKAIISCTVTDDYETQGNSFELHQINYESLHKVPKTTWDVIIIDEAHKIGAFPKAGKNTKQCKILKEKAGHVILMSGTPSPESYSQMYHQLWGLQNSPFAQYSNFYKFAKDHVIVEQRRRAYGQLANYYGNCKDSVFQSVTPYMVGTTQEESGFKCKISENFLRIELPEETRKIIDEVENHGIVEFEDTDYVILADTMTKVRNKVSQLVGGSVKLEHPYEVENNGKKKTITKILSTTRAKAIREKFGSRKIAIFYRFKAEREIILSIWGDEVTDDIQEFHNSDKSFCCHVRSGREGISLKQAEALVFYNIEYSALSYWQARDRMSHIDREENEAWWIFSDHGIEEDIYKVVVDKKDYTVSYYKELIKKR